MTFNVTAKKPLRALCKPDAQRHRMNFDYHHLAIASAHGIDYLVTWNCTHIARGEVKKALEQINDLEGIVTPTTCTPEELTGG